MQFSENWLRSIVDPKMSSDELSHLLTMSGLEVEEVEAVAPPFKVLHASIAWLMRPGLSHTRRVGTCAHAGSSHARMRHKPAS